MQLGCLSLSHTHTPGNPCVQEKHAGRLFFSFIFFCYFAAESCVNHCTAAAAAAAAAAPAHLAPVKGGWVCFEGGGGYYFFLPFSFFHVDKPDWEWLGTADWPAKLER